MTAEIRPLAERDLPGVAGLRWRWYHDRHRQADTTLDDFTREVQSWWDRVQDYVGLVATVEAQLVGMGFLAVVHRVPWPGDASRCYGDVQSLYVLPDFRGRGIGRQLVDELARRAASSGCIRITVNSSDRAVTLYTGAGFELSPNLLVRSLEPSSTSSP